MIHSFHAVLSAATDTTTQTVTASPAVIAIWIAIGIVGFVTGGILVSISRRRSILLADAAPAQVVRPRELVSSH